MLRGIRRCFCVTYEGPNFALPLDKLRSSQIYKPDLWSWLYHCRRVYAPFPPPHPDVPWPDFYYVWVGPDGFPIFKGSDKTLEQYRAKLHYAMSLKSKTAKAKQALGWVVDLPLVKSIPPLLDVGFGVGRGF